jgi:hypothetical protein
VAQKEWILAAATGLLSVVLFTARGRPAARGEVIDGPITIVPADANRLECALSRAVGRYRCAYREKDARWVPEPESMMRMAPYLTQDRTLYLVPGLFDVTSVRLFASRRGPNDRFVARCKLRLVERVTDFAIRFQPDGPWEPRKDPVWLAEPVSCDPTT